MKGQEGAEKVKTCWGGRYESGRLYLYDLGDVNRSLNLRSPSKPSGVSLSSSETEASNDDKDPGRLQTRAQITTVVQDPLLSLPYLVQKRLDPD